jgi:hypothetical protein
MLTSEQVKARIETGFAPHTAKAEFHDYGAKLTLRVRSATTGKRYLLPDVPMDSLDEGFLKDIIDGTRREVDA